MPVGIIRGSSTKTKPSLVQQVNQLRAATNSNVARGADAVVQGIKSASLKANRSIARLQEAIVRGQLDKTSVSALNLLRSRTTNPDADRFNPDVVKTISFFQKNAKIGKAKA